MSYNPAIGRFLERDPIGYDDGMNLYQFVRSNPIRYVDPFGLATFNLPIELAKSGKGTTLRADVDVTGPTRAADQEPDVYRVSISLTRDTTEAGRNQWNDMADNEWPMERWGTDDWNYANFLLMANNSIPGHYGSNGPGGSDDMVVLYGSDSQSGWSGSTSAWRSPSVIIPSNDAPKKTIAEWRKREVHTIVADLDVPITCGSGETELWVFLADPKYFAVPGTNTKQGAWGDFRVKWSWGANGFAATVTQGPGGQVPYDIAKEFAAFPDELQEAYPNVTPPPKDKLEWNPKF